MKTVAKAYGLGYKTDDADASKGKMMKKPVFFLGLFFTATSIFSNFSFADAFDQDFYEVGKVTSEVVQIEEKEIIDPEQFIPTNPTNPQTTINPPTPIPTIPPIFTNPNPMQPGQPNPLMILDLAIKAWQIVKDGAPIVNVNSKNASALPFISSGRWEMLTGWKSERAISYKVTVENVYGMETVSFEYTVGLIYGGNVGGKGKYIASARVIPKKVDVLWGYNLDVTVDVPNIFNVAETDNPNAAITLDVTYKVSTILRSTAYTNTYELRGDGTMKSNGKLIVGPNACFAK
jgi:hypothetical protein